MKARKNRNVLLFLAEGFEDLEAVTILDVCGWTEYRDDIPTVQVVTTGFHNKIHGRFGLAIKPDILFSNVNVADYAAIALPGGFHSHGFDEAYDSRVYDLIRSIHALGGTVATMCVGILPVAEAGILKGRHATTYPHSRRDNFAKLRELGVIAMNESVVVDNRIISCAGPAQSIDVTLLLLENIVGFEAASDVRKYLMYEGVKQ